MKRLWLFVLCFALPVAAEEFGASSVWRPADDFRQQVIADCGGAGARFRECFASRMKGAAASPAALSFSAALFNEGYMQEFRDCGRVSIAAVTYPFRANENQGLLLLNGEPALVDVDKIQQLPTKGWSQILQRWSKANLWPSARDRAERITVENRKDKGQRFVVEYRVQDGCHACALLGRAYYAFDFDEAGKFLGPQFQRFSPR